MDVRRTGRSYRRLIEADIEMLPLMNLFIVLIPMLLLSAVFVEVTAIDMAMPGADPSESAPEEEPFRLSVEIAPDAYVIDGNRVDRRVIDWGTPAGTPSPDAAHETLRAALAGIAERHPENRAVQILSRPRTRYREIIAVMDASREAGLPHVGLGDAAAPRGVGDVAVRDVTNEG